jgi:hypothetical protein
MIDEHDVIKDFDKLPKQTQLEVMAGRRALRRKEPGAPRVLPPEPVLPPDENEDGFELKAGDIVNVTVVSGATEPATGGTVVIEDPEGAKQPVPEVTTPTAPKPSPFAMKKAK